MLEIFIKKPIILTKNINFYACLNSVYLDEKIANNNFEACPIFNEKDHLNQSFKSKSDKTY